LIDESWKTGKKESENPSAGQRLAMIVPQKKRQSAQEKQHSVSNDGY